MPVYADGRDFDQRHPRRKILIIFRNSGDFMQSCMIFVPFIGWLVAVIIKFITNYIYYSTLDLKLSFSNGGFPSVHTATIITTTTYIGFYDNFNSPLFILAVTIAFIIMIDATHLRRSIGKHASILNHLTGKADLHEKEGHTYFQVISGAIIGILTGYILYNFF